MRKDGSVLGVIGIVFLILIILIAGVGFYFYNYYVFKTVRVCIGNATDSRMLCNFSSDCIDFVVEQGLNINLSDAPNFIVEAFQKIIDDVVYCNKTCFVKKVRGVDNEIEKLGTIDNCRYDETEFVINIRGKEGIEILKYSKKIKNN